MVVESISKDVNGFIYAIGGFTVLSAGGASIVTVLTFLKEETKVKNDDRKRPSSRRSTRKHDK